MELFSPVFEILKSLAATGAHIATAIIALLLAVIMIQNRRMFLRMYSRSHSYLSEPAPSLDCRINNMLGDAVAYLEAGSVALVQWHNGTRGMTGIPFYFASLTHIRPLDKVDMLANSSNQRFQSSLIATTHDLLKTNFMIEYPDVEKMREHDMGLYYILARRGCKSAYIAGVYDLFGTPIAYLGVHFYAYREIDDRERQYINRLAKLLSGALTVHAYERRQ